MDNNVNRSEQYSVPAYTYSADAAGNTVQEEASPVMQKARLKRSYGTATTSMIIHVVVLIIITLIATFAATGKLTAQIISENPDMPQAELMQKVQESTSEIDLSLATYIGGTLAGIIAIFCAYKILGTFKLKDSLNTKWRKVNMLPAGIASVIGIQGISIIVITLMFLITGKTGMPESSQNVLSYSDDLLHNAAMLLYVVVVGPLLEELLFRGFILNALSPVDKRFAVVVSAALFSLMHGNFAQFFNTFFVGLLLGYIAVKAGSIIPTIIAHVVLNLNAMVPELIFSGNESGGMIYYIACIVIGLPLLILFLVKNRKITDEDRCIEGYDMALPKTSEYTVKTLFSCPSFWVVTVYYLVNAVVLFINS